MKVLFSYNIVMDSLDSIVHLSGNRLNEKSFNSFIGTLESASESLFGGEMGYRSTNILKNSLEKYLNIPSLDENSIPIELDLVVDKLKNYGTLENSEIGKLAIFCKTFHEYSMDERYRALKELQQ